MRQGRHRDASCQTPSPVCAPRPVALLPRGNTDGAAFSVFEAPALGFPGEELGTVPQARWHSAEWGSRAFLCEGGERPAGTVAVLHPEGLLLDRHPWGLWDSSGGRGAWGELGGVRAGQPHTHGARPPTVGPRWLCAAVGRHPGWARRPVSLSLSLQRGRSSGSLRLSRTHSRTGPRQFYGSPRLHWWKQ